MEQNYMDENKPVCHFLIGLPGSGKSTWARKSKLNLPIISSDSYIESLAAAKGKTYTDAFAEVSDQAIKLFNQELNTAISNKESFIWDQTNLTKNARANKLKKLKGYTIIGHFWNVPESELSQRRSNRKDKTIPYGVLKNMAATQQIPSPEEGFDQIFIHS